MEDENGEDGGGDGKSGMYLELFGTLYSNDAWLNFSPSLRPS
jgi:hypothetical protein